ncbi:MAG: hypothetical protein JOZ24_02230, partial [Candidatus Eremiobacteraeota bacterium]|nr:hypothetical protein [Candidatus Eremiobacteraeota bacterium]
YYALVALVAVRIPSRAPAVAGLSWVVFSAIGSLGAFPLPPVLHAVTRVLKIVDPFAYLSMRGDHVQVVISTTSAADAWIPTLPLIPRAGLAAAIAAVALVAMVRLWSTREVTA